MLYIIQGEIENKNETTRFLGDGVSFKAKLIGILEVSEARGDRMCQEALSDLKMAIRAAGEHKQRITINIAIDGLRLRDEKTGDSLYHHPVHKISFIAQDMTDSRAFGYIFGSPDTGHRFFGIKTDKAASQQCEIFFQVVFALKKKEIELAKQHLEKTCYPTSPLFSDTSTSKTVPHVSIKSTTEHKSGSSTNDSKASGTAVADLVDLELELNSLQQGLNQMERITPSDPFGSKDDPFGDSFINYTSKPILPPPPSSGRERSNRTSDSSSFFSPKTPHTASVETVSSDKKKDFSFSQDFSSSHEESSSSDWITSSTGNSIFKEAALSVQETTKDEKHEQTKKEILSQFDVFTEVRSFGSKPYIDRKHFFQELKNPPKKVLNDLVSRPTQEQPSFSSTFNQVIAKPTQTILPNLGTGVFTNDPFGEDPFVRDDPFADSDFSKQDPFETEFANFPNNQIDKFSFESKKDTLQNLLRGNLSKSPLEKQMSLLSSSPKTVQFGKLNSFDVQFDKFDKLSQQHENPSLDISSESECAPEPPPRPASTLMQIKPPPLPPKKQINDLAVKPPPRPPYHSEDSPYDYMDKYETAPNSLEYIKTVEKSPPLPVPSRKSKFESDFTCAPERPKKQFNISTPLEGLDITLSQLTLSGLNELAQKLDIPASQLSNMTLVQLTNFLSNYIKSNTTTVPGKTSTGGNFNANNEFPTFQADFASNFNNLNNTSNSTTYDRYAVFRELMQDEIKQTKIDSEPEEIQEEQEKLGNSGNSNVNLDLKPINEEQIDISDRYAALREIVDTEFKQSVVEKNNVNQNQGQNEIEDIAEEEEDDEEEEPNLNEDETKEMEDINIVDKENKINEDKEDDISPIRNIMIEYPVTLETKDAKVSTSEKSPVKSPVKSALIKSPLPSSVTDIMQNNIRPNSGSLSDVISGSSPEVDNTASNSEIGKKIADATGESWAIFDRGVGRPLEEVKEKQAVQSEEGVSPWSSDSKEFGNGSPTEWRSKDSGSGTEQWPKRTKDQEGWWDTSAEPEVNYYPPNRRSMDSYDEEYYGGYERPRRRRQGNWQHGVQATGGHSSSSRDVSPWEEEPRRREPREGRELRPGYRHPRGHSYERHRRPTDSWDEEDDYEEGRHSAGSRDHESERRLEDWNEDRRHRRRRDMRDRWCCPDWEQSEHVWKWEMVKSRHAAWKVGVTLNTTNDITVGNHRNRLGKMNIITIEDSPHYLSAKRNWRQRPSSASEMDRKMGEIKSRHYLGMGGSDGERDRRSKVVRRSRSRDSQFSEPSHRFKPDPGPPIRNPHRSKPHSHPKPIDTDFAESPLNSRISSKFNYDNDFETSEAESPTINRTSEECKTTGFCEGIEIVFRDIKQKGSSLFEDDFSPSQKPDTLLEDNSISSIKEEVDPEEEEEDSFDANNVENATNDINLKKSESVNIFARESDPFDDDFFCAEDFENYEKSPEMLDIDGLKILKISYK
ncbi:hypothetical protein NQ317_015785 [Molorchus minor]|uniref:PID domain-containing protein n=1 Tax=Molorchus minor TaxID=1323400 RepID=A0ABQ9J477_9CUCU|nr:hypothetical protein NQ317_015785 [Molorchus minor]